MLDVNQQVTPQAAGGAVEANDLHKQVGIATGISTTESFDRDGSDTFFSLFRCRTQKQDGSVAGSKPNQKMSQKQIQSKDAQLRQ